MRTARTTTLLALLASLLICLPALALDKQAAYDEMLALGQQIRELKASRDDSAAAKLAEALDRYAALSAALGGDDPASLVPDDAPASPSGAASAPPPPVGCTTASTSGANNTPLPIPDSGGATVSSTINIAGAGTYLWDVDLTVAITHTFPGDLDFTLTSPAGTVVTISSDNGGSSDDVWNGTTFDDDANPGGQVPYTTNNGLVGDHAYATGVVATPLAPEEALIAFRGENPNGTWTITLDDDAGGDVGTLNSWSISLTTLNGTPTVSSVPVVTNNTPLPIPDSGGATVSSTVNVAGAGTYLWDANLVVAITHTFPGDLDFTLTSPAGTVVTISSDNGGSSDDVWNGTTFDDDANPGGQVPYSTNNGLVGDHAYATGVVATPLAPEEALGAFVGENPNGTWTITLDDDAGGDTGTLNSWSVALQTAVCGCQLDLTCPGDIAVPAPPGAQSQVVTFADPVVGGTCTNVTTSCVPASGDGFPVGDTLVVCTAVDGVTGTQASCNFTVSVGSQTIQEIPTASTLGLAALALLLAGAAFVALRRG